MTYHDSRLIELETIETTCFKDRYTGFFIKVEQYSDYTDVTVFDGPHSMNPIISYYYPGEEVAGMSAEEIAAHVIK